MIIIVTVSCFKSSEGVMDELRDFAINRIAALFKNSGHKTHS